MNNNYILGAGPAGLIAAYYFSEYKIIDEKPLGQLNLPFIPGPRLLQATDNMKSFIKEVLPKSQISLEIVDLGPARYILGWEPGDLKFSRNIK